MSRDGGPTLNHYYVNISSLLGVITIIIHIRTKDYIISCYEVTGRPDYTRVFPGENTFGSVCTKVFGFVIH